MNEKNSRVKGLIFRYENFYLTRFAPNISVNAALERFRAKTLPKILGNYSGSKLIAQTESFWS